MKNADLQNDLNNLSHRGIHKSFDNMQVVLKKLGHPETSYPIVHVAGTNGKGSSCTFLAQLMSQNGYRVGLALSPHVETFSERIQLYTPTRQGVAALISDEELISVHTRLKKIDAQMFGLTYFEYALLMAIEWFREQKVDLVILETGLGGRWDATNACPSIVSGIVSVGLDHMKELGDTLPKILLEKIEIAKPNSDFVFAPKDFELVQIAKEFCEKRNVSYFDVEPCDDFLAKQETTDFPGFFLSNLQFSVTLAKRLNAKNFKFDRQKRYNLSLPFARFEVLQKNPVVVLDGAHNEPALLALRKSFTDLYGQNYDLIFGCLKDRDAIHLAKSILPNEGERFWVRFPADGREMSMETSEKLQQSYGGQHVEFNKEFVEFLKGLKRTRPLMVCGSFYLCGVFRTLFAK